MPANQQQDRARVHSFVSGYVQAVGFREFVRRHAVAAGLTGWVRNLPDGRVELVAEGPRAAAEALLRHVQQGPHLAWVEAVDTGWGVSSGSEPAFDIR